MNILGIDVGGSGIKGALVNTEDGTLVAERIRIPTPASFAMDEVADVIAQIVSEHNYTGPVGVGFPAAVRPEDGIVLTPPTALHYPGWEGNSASEVFSDRSGCPVTVINDADAAGLAEVRFGAGQGVSGTVLALTLGTGVGSGLFYNGQLVANSELGKLYLSGHTHAAELYMASRIKEEQNLKYRQWAPRLNEYLEHIEFLFSPRLIVIGGGISKRFEKFEPYLTIKTKVVPAQMRNQAGIVGAAAAAMGIPAIA